MKKYNKIISLVLIVMVMLSVNTSVFAAKDKKATGTDAFTPGNVSADTSGTTNIQTIGNNIMGIVQVVGTITSVIILVVLGIKYMLGSAEEKAEYKKTMLPYVIGAVMIFAASTLANMIYSWANTLG